MPLKLPFTARRDDPEPEEAPLAPPGEADAILDRLLPREEIIDRFDATYLDDLPDLLREIHGVTDANARQSAIWPDLEALWRLSDRDPEQSSIADLRKALIEGAGVDERRWTPKIAPPEEQKRQKYDRTRILRKVAGLRVGRSADPESVEAVKALQVSYSHDVQGGRHEVAFDELSRPETGDPWSDLIRRLREEGVLSPDEQHLTIGPRWVGEIHYFRTQLGLPQTIGLDLFTHDDALVTVGDMHEMPFEDSTFGLVYQRNTFDKAYDIRRTLRECARVLRAGGVLISDDCYAYTQGVSQLGRTGIKHNRQILRVLGDHAGEVLYDVETPSAEDWIERVGQLAVKIRK
jgi:hypothetical protein